MTGNRLPRVCAIAVAAVTLAGVCSSCSGPGHTAEATEPAAPGAVVPRFDHVVVVIEENRSYADIVGNTGAPYIDALAAQGVSFANSYAETHPSQPNYLALFSGDTQGVRDDTCPQTFTGVQSLASQLTAAGRTFAGYSESMPAPGYTGCAANGYARKHAPWVDFDTVPATENRSFAAFPADFRTLPAVSFVVPDLSHDMHNGTIASADTWLKNDIDAYAQWAVDNNSLLVLTWDEDDFGATNHIPTIFFGAHVQPGTRDERIDHYTVLRTIEEAFGLPALGHAAAAAPITDAWAHP